MGATIYRAEGYYAYWAVQVLEVWQFKMQEHKILLTLGIPDHCPHSFSMDSTRMPQAFIRSTFIILSRTRIPWRTFLIS